MRLQLFFFLLICIGNVTAADLPRTSFFVANEGQWEAPFAFRYDGAGGSYYITLEGMTIDLRQYERSAITEEPDQMPWERRDSRPELVRGHVVKVKYLNASTNPEIVGEDILPHYSNYFLGPDSCKWRSFVGHYRRVTAKNVWAGVDVEYRIEPEGIESVYHLAAGVDPSVIQIQYNGLDAALRTDNQGNLILQTSLGVIREKAPYACQVWQGKREEVAVAYEITGNNTVRLVCSGYDRNIGMVIDPLLYSSYLGTTDLDAIECIDHDSQGNIILCGETDSPSFPVTIGAYQTINRGIYDVFVSKFRSQGDSLLFSTYIGSNDPDYSNGMLVNMSDRIYITGYIEGGNGWPLTTDAFDTVHAGNIEGFLCRLSSDGAQLGFSSYLGGANDDQASSLDVDSMDLIYITGITGSTDFPVTPHALYNTLTGVRTAFISVFNPESSSLFYSTFFTGVGDIFSSNVRIVMPMLVWITGGDLRGYSIPVTSDALFSESEFEHNPFLARLDLAHGEVEYASYFPGSIENMTVIDSSRLFLCGSTGEADYPTTASAFDTSRVAGPYRKGFAMFLALPSIVEYSTLLGALTSHYSTFIISSYNMRDSGKIVLAGKTAAPDFPVTPDAFDSTQNGWMDGFLTVFSSDLSHLQYSTFFGGSNPEDYGDMDCDAPDSYWIVGETQSVDFPTTPNAYQPVSPDNGWGNGFFMHFYLPDSNSAVSDIRVLFPQDISLSVFPNPFNSATTLSYILPYTNKLDIRIFDLLGRSVYTQELGRIKAGRGSIPLDLSAFPSGVYYLQMQSSSQQANTKLIHIR